jgi:2-dehydro-3-deoxyphosphogluconate aldolase/(4S)-4-hydroxy-2-oxoglutarate aldolase
MPVIGIMRNLSPEQVRLIAAPYAAAGLTNLEVTMNSAAAETSISWLVNNYSQKLNIGAGTVCNLPDLEKALEAGAQFIVTPILNKKVVKACVKAGIPVFPGAYTPTEIYQAWELGAAMVKVFPAAKLGTAYIKEVLAPLNHLKLVPTGGITQENCTDFFTAGAEGVGMGSSLFPPELIQKNDWEALTKFYAGFMEQLQPVVNALRK